MTIKKEKRGDEQQQQKKERQQKRKRKTKNDAAMFFFFNMSKAFVSDLEFFLQKIAFSVYSTSRHMPIKVGASKVER